MIEAKLRPDASGVDRWLYRFWQMEWLTAYEVPEVLAHSIKQPEGVEVVLTGERENVGVSGITREGSFDFAQVAPEGTIFTVRDHLGANFSAEIHQGKAVVEIPPGRRKEKETVLSLLHAISRLWGRRDERLSQLLDGALETAKDQIRSLHAYGRFTWSEEAESLKREQQAWSIIAANERRISAAAIYLAGCLRLKLQVDPLPHIRSLHLLTRLVNSNFLERISCGIYRGITIDLAEKKGIYFHLREDEVLDTLKGKMHWPDLKRLIDQGLEETFA